MRYKGKEDDFQIAVAMYLNTLRLLWCHVPNESLSKVQYRVKLSRKGVKSGVPDVLIFNPRKGYNGLAIELKANYNKPSDEQIMWLNMLQMNGWQTHWTNDLDECMRIIDEYLKD